MKGRETAEHTLHTHGVHHAHHMPQGEPVFPVFSTLLIQIQFHAPVSPQTPCVRRAVATGSFESNKGREHKFLVGPEDACFWDRVTGRNGGYGWCGDQRLLQEDHSGSVLLQAASPAHQLLHWHQATFGTAATNPRTQTGRGLVRGGC